MRLIRWARVAPCVAMAFAMSADHAVAQGRGRGARTIGPASVVVSPLHVVALRPTIAPLDAAAIQRRVAGLARGPRVAPAGPLRPPLGGAPRPADVPTPHLSFSSLLGTRYDSNVNRDTIPITSVGVVTGIGVRLQGPGRRPWLVAEYDAAWHRYSATERFNRVSQRLRLTTDARLSRALTLGVATEGALRGSAEDRDLTNQLALLPRVELRLSDRTRIRLVGAQRWRVYPEAPRQNARNAYAAVELRQRSTDGSSWEGEFRLERNAADSTRYDFDRTTFATTYSTPIGSRWMLDLEGRFRTQRYPHRLVEVDDIDVPRRDFRWEPSIGWRWLGRIVQVELRYEPEYRGSNDPGRNFTQHFTSLGVTRRW